MKLPPAFVEAMRALLRDEADALFDAFSHAPYRGISVNTSKLTVSDFLAIAPFAAAPVAWSPSGLSIRDDFEPGRHPYYHAGLYYVQEPSAMLPVELLGIKGGEIVLDACAAPGGKSMQMLAQLRAIEATDSSRAAGLVIACDLAESRAKAILRNAERYGARDFILLREDARHVAASPLIDSVDTVLLDAPCSGEGMFRKDPKAVRSWIERGPSYYESVQRELLEAIARRFRGEMVYSNCTWNRSENEAVLESAAPVGSDGKPVTIDVLETRRIYPHRDEGEGHFAARLRIAACDDAVRERAQSDTPAAWTSALRGSSAGILLREAPPECADFLGDLTDDPMFHGVYELRGEELFLLPRRVIDLSGRQVMRCGLLVGSLAAKGDRGKRRFTPSQALAHYLEPGRFARRIDLKLDDPRVMKYLRGETIEVSCADSGHHLVCVDGFALGFAAVQHGVFKNLYKSSWRIVS